MKLETGPHYVGQHFLQYEDKRLLMRRWYTGMIRMIWLLWFANAVRKDLKRDGWYFDSVAKMSLFFTSR